MEHLKQASKNVGNWPEWKKDLAGVIESPRTAGYLLPYKSVEMLAEIYVEHQHDHNGPGEFSCPACGESVKMKWKTGRILNDESEIVHEEYCPISWARKILSKKDR